MDWKQPDTAIALTFLCTIAVIVLMYVGYRFINWATELCNLLEEWRSFKEQYRPLEIFSSKIVMEDRYLKDQRYSNSRLNDIENHLGPRLNKGKK